MTVGIEYYYRGGPYAKACPSSTADFSHTRRGDLGAFAFHAVAAGTAYTFAPAGGVASGGHVVESFTPPGAPAKAPLEYAHRGQPYAKAATVGTADFSHAHRGSLDSIVFHTAATGTAYTFSPSGGLATGGRVVVGGGTAYTFSPSGGVASGGHVDLSGYTTFIVSPSGGIACGGVARPGWTAVPFKPGPWAWRLWEPR